MLGIVRACTNGHNKQQFASDDVGDAWLMEMHFKDMVPLLQILVLLDDSDSHSRIGDGEHCCDSSGWKELDCWICGWSAAERVPLQLLGIERACTNGDNKCWGSLSSLMTVTVSTGLGMRRTGVICQNRRSWIGVCGWSAPAGCFSPVMATAPATRQSPIKKQEHCNCRG